MSTDRQLEGHSLARQTQATKDYCLANNLDLIDELADIGVSGYSGANTSRGQLGVFFEALRKGEIAPNTVLIVESLDRLSRQDPLTAMGQFTEMLSYGIELHTLFDRQIYSKESIGTNAGQLFLSIGAMVRAHEESATKSKRLKAVWSSKKNDQTRIVTSQVPFWINVKKDKSGRAASFELNETDANVIRHIFRLSINQNMGAQAITSYLNKNIDKFPKSRSSARNKDNGWSESYIKSVLNNPAVYGVYQPHKKVDGKRVADGDAWENYYPQVITQEEFLLNKSKMQQRKIKGKGRKSKNFQNLFRGLIHCKSCGSKMSFKDNIKAKGGPIIRCDLAKQRRGSCESLPVRYQTLEDLFFTVMRDVDFASAIQNQDFKSKARELEIHINSIEAQTKTLELKIDQMVDELLVPELPEPIKKRLRDKLSQATNEHEALKTKLDDLRQEELLAMTNGVGSLFDDVRSLMDGLDDDELAMLRSSVNAGLHKVFERIDIDNTPEFFSEELEAEMITVEDLNPDFLEWFFSTRANRGMIKDPLAYVASRMGYKKHQDFRTVVYVKFKNGELRGILADGSFVRIRDESEVSATTSDNISNKL
jgi:DNA invertase Pin-like site-specific DNA recombinase